MQSTNYRRSSHTYSPIPIYLGTVTLPTLEYNLIGFLVFRLKKTAHFCRQHVFFAGWLSAIELAPQGWSAIDSSEQMSFQTAVAIDVSL